MSTPLVDVAVVSSRGLADLNEDDRMLTAALRSAGLAAQPVPWRGGVVDWSRVRAAIVRSTWDYTENLSAFLEWVDTTAAQCLVINAPEVIRWNADKRYLRELEERGFDVVPTLWFQRGENADLWREMEAAGWTRAVFKPVVSAGARNTYRADIANRSDHGEHFADLLSAGDMMLQPYMERIESEGEMSLTFIDGEYAHAVVKKPGTGDYRVQAELGGSLDSVRLDRATVEGARRILDAVEGDVAYARVDVVPDDTGRLHVMELELIEPELFLRFDPKSIDALVAAITRRLPA